MSSISVLVLNRVHEFVRYRPRSVLTRLWYRCISLSARCDARFGGHVSVGVPGHVTRRARRRPMLITIVDVRTHQFLRCHQTTTSTRTARQRKREGDIDAELTDSLYRDALLLYQSILQWDPVSYQIARIAKFPQCATTANPNPNPILYLFYTYWPC